MRTPPSVNLAATAWLLAIAAGVIESVLALTDIGSRGAWDAGVWVGLAVRVAVFVAGTLLAVRLRRGSNAARIALTVLLSGLGFASLVVPSTLAMAGGASFVEAFGGDGGELAGVFLVVRLLHIALVVVATVGMYTP